MNNKTLVKLSNTIGIISIILLVYWVFVFIAITVFGFKIFRQNITETFYFSVVGILALMMGSLIINVMFNLTRIAEKHNNDFSTQNSKSLSKKLGIIFLISFPIIFGLLYGGDYLTARKKEKMLTATAQSIIVNNEVKSNKLLKYQFDEKWIIDTAEVLLFLSKTDRNFPFVRVIVPDSVEQSKVFLEFSNYYHGKLSDTIKPKKRDFIFSTTQEERDYLSDIFYNNKEEIRFSAYNGSYELFYPYIKDGKRIVFYFSETQQYGKIGS